MHRLSKPTASATPPTRRKQQTPVTLPKTPNQKNDSVAQLVEQLTLNQWVEGSSPSGVTKWSVRPMKTSENKQFSEVFLFAHTPNRCKILGQLQNPVELLKSHTNKNHHPKCPTSQIIFRSIIGEPEARGLLLTPARRTRSGRRPGHNAIQTEYKPGTGSLWFNRCLYHSSPVPGLSIRYSCGRGLRTVPVLRTPVKDTLEPPALHYRNFNN